LLIIEIEGLWIPHKKNVNAEKMENVEVGKGDHRL